MYVRWMQICIEEGSPLEMLAKKSLNEINCDQKKYTGQGTIFVHSKDTNTCIESCHSKQESANFQPS